MRNIVALWSIAALLVGIAGAMPRAAGAAGSTAAATGATLLAEAFSTGATAPNAWSAYGDACLTAGTAATPATSIPACGARAPQDAVGQGALALTSAAAQQGGMIVANAPLATANGLQVTFTDDAFEGTSPGADGLAFFFTDASQPRPVLGAGRGGTLGYSGTAALPGLAHAYVGIGLDEFGNFSSSLVGGAGGPGTVKETIAVRGAAATLWAYLGGVGGANGRPASLPFALDAPAAAARPANAPTIRGTLTPAGMLSVAVDRHDGNGFVTYYTQSIVGVAGQPAVPAHVYFGFSAATGGKWNAHQISGLVVSTLTPPNSAAMLTAETFALAATSPNAWAAFGDACLTAGTPATPVSSLPACGASAPLDAAGSGALQLTAAGGDRRGMVISRVPLPTSGGLQITFTADAFGGSVPGADGLAFFFTDASQPLPTTFGGDGGALGYASSVGVAGLANGYLGVALDSYGDFSNPADGRNGGPGRIPQTIAVRGAAATHWQYVGGTRNSAGQAASLPFALDAAGAALRPANPPTVRAILSPSGVLSVAVNRHDGNGFATYFSQPIAGAGGQPALPAAVYFGLSAATGTLDERHQVSGLTIASAGPPPAVSALQNPPSLISTNGSLVFNVSAQSDPASGQPRFSYNGSTVPPTLRVLPGDTLVVNLTNNLPVAPAGAGYTNDVNVHYHGLHVSPLAPGDDSIDMLAAPGQSLHYALAIPVDHPPGLYWYHSHAHGEAERQTLAGMSGALIVDGIAAYTPQVANMTERVLIARDAPLAGTPLPAADLRAVYAMKWAMRQGVMMHAAGGSARAPGATVRAAVGRTELHASSTQRSHDPYLKSDPTYRRFVRSQVADTHCTAGSSEAPVKALTLNGQTQPALAIAPGEQQFWRMVNAGADTYLDVAVDNSQLQIIALDGVPLVSGVGAPASMLVSHWVLPPASRVEFIVTGPPAGTPAYLRTNCFDAGPAGAPMPAAILASIAPAVTPQARHSARRAVARISPRAQRFTFHRTAVLHTAAGIRAATVVASRTLYYSDQNTINGIAYDPAAPPQFYAQSGTVEEWTIQNNSSQVHTFHIHQVHFVVEAIDGTTQSPQFVMDNVNVPAASASGPGTVKLLLDFTDPAIVGTFLIHCHILAHEDQGMMAKIRIGTAPPLNLSSASVSFSGPAAALQSVKVSGGAAPLSVTGCSGVAAAAVNGNTVSIVPAGAGACVLTIADSSNPSITATIAVSVAAAPAAMTLAPASANFTSPVSTAQAVQIAGGSPPYAAGGCPGIVAVSVSGAALGLTPLAAGACSLVVSDAAGDTAALPVSVNAAADGNPLDNLTFHQNPQRTGWYRNETALTPASVASTSFGQIGTLAPPSTMPALAKVYAQPLFVTGETASDGRQHNLIIVASANDQVYAFDETTRAVVWHRSFTNAAAGIRQQLWTDTQCTDVNPDVGIVGTPVIDRTRDALYVVVATNESGANYTRLHALGLGTGNDIIAPAAIAGSVAMPGGGIATIDSQRNMNRAALLEADGNIYVALGSHCDGSPGSVHGWIMAYNAQTLVQTGSLVDLANANNGTNSYLGSVWMSGFGPAADAAGSIYFATGNGPFNGTTDFGMSVLKLPGNLDMAAASYFAPAQAVVDAQADADLGAGGVVLLPDQSGAQPHLLFAGGKCSANNAGCFKYLLDRDALGGQHAANAGAAWSAPVGGGSMGGAAYFADAAGGQHLVFGTGAPLSTFSLGENPVGLTVQSSANVGCLECRDEGSQPIVSSNGTAVGTAIVWALQTPGNAGGTISLYAFNALAMNVTLFKAPAGVWTRATGTTHIGGALISPLVADGRVYVPSDGAVAVFGLKP